MPELIADPDYTTGPARSNDRDALNAEISARTAQRSTDEWVNERNTAGVPCGPFHLVDQMFADEPVKRVRIA